MTQDVSLSFGNLVVLVLGTSTATAVTTAIIEAIKAKFKTDQTETNSAYDLISGLDKYVDCAAALIANIEEGPDGSASLLEVEKYIDLSAIKTQKTAIAMALLDFNNSVERYKEEIRFTERTFDRHDAIQAFLESQKKLGMVALGISKAIRARQRLPLNDDLSKLASAIFDSPAQQELRPIDAETH